VFYRKEFAMNDEPVDVKEGGGEEAILEAPSAEEPKATEEVETPSEEPEPTGEGETEETKTETEETPKKGAQARIRELNAKARSAEDKANSLEAKLAALTGSGEPRIPEMHNEPQIEPGAEVSPEQYERNVTQKAMSAAQLVIAQNNAVNRINTEASQVINTYPQLDPDSDQFDKELSEAVTEATLAQVKAQPYTASPKSIVEKLMKPYTRAVTKEVGKETANLAKQVAESATRPTSISTKSGKADEEKTVEELREELGVYVS
jgi:hypothetical protein